MTDMEMIMLANNFKSVEKAILGAPYDICDEVNPEEVKDRTMILRRKIFTALKADLEKLKQ